MEKEELLRKTAQAIMQAASGGVLGKPIQIFCAETIAGPRAGAVRLYAGLQSGQLYRVLAADNCALARQFIAWPFQEVQVFFDGSAVRVEAPWPQELATRTVLLRNICRSPKGRLRFALGIDEFGSTIIASFGDNTPHWLTAGATGSGKTTALLTIGYQMTQDPRARLVLVDGKGGASLVPLTNAPNVLGPIARSVDEARRALGWVNAELQRRYSLMEQGISDFEYAIIVIVDEFQEFTQDGICAELLRRIVTAGRAAQIHCVLATQHPTWKAFGGEMAIKRNLPGRLALRVLDQKASEVVLGRPQPRADLLAGAGDAYVVGATAIHRVQIALVDKAEWESLPRYETPIRAWGPLTDLGQDPARGGFTGRELAAGLIAAKLGFGRIKLIQLLQRLGLGAGSVRADRLLALGREALEALAELGFVVKQVEAAIPHLGGEE